MVSPRLVCACSSVALVTSVNVIGLRLAAEQFLLGLLLTVAIATVTAVQSAGWNPGDLVWSLLFSVPAVAVLLAEGGPSWLVGPLAVLLLVAAELNVASWELRGTSFADAAVRIRLLQVGQLGAASLVAVLTLVTLGSAPRIGGTAALGLAALALAATAAVLFRGR